MVADIIEFERNRIALLNRKIERDLVAFGLDPHRASFLACVAVASITKTRPKQPQPERC